jgi:hypothetical protein
MNESFSVRIINRGGLSTQTIKREKKKNKNKKVKKKNKFPFFAKVIKNEKPRCTKMIFVPF